MNQHTLRTESLFQLTWPVFLQHTTHSLVLFVDFWFFSTISDATAATVGQLIPVMWLGAFVIPVFAGTGVSVASQFMGARQFDKVVPTYMMNLLCTFVISTVFALLLWLLSPQIGRWMGLDESLNAIGSTYLGTMSLYFVFLGVQVAYNAVLSSRGMTHWLMYNSIVVAVLNLALVSLFVFGLGAGVRGIVTASIISIAVGTVMAMGWVHRRLQIRFYLRGALRDMRGIAGPMLRIGISNALEPLSYTLQQIILSTMIISLGLVSMAANSYSARVQMFQITFSISLALGSQILMAHWMGARRFDDVDRLFWRVVRRTTLVAGAYTVTLWLLSDFVLRIFTSDPDVTRTAHTLLLVAVFLEPARAVNIVSGFALKTVGDARFPLIVGMTFIWGVLPIVLVLDQRWGLTIAGFWICFAADEIIRAGINLWRWKSGKWRSMGIAIPTTTVAPTAPVAAPVEAV